MKKTFLFFILFLFSITLVSGVTIFEDTFCYNDGLDSHPNWTNAGCPTGTELQGFNGFTTFNRSNFFDKEGFGCGSNVYGPFIRELSQTEDYTIKMKLDLNPSSQGDFFAISTSDQDTNGQTSPFLNVFLFGKDGSLNYRYSGGDVNDVVCLHCGLGCDPINNVSTFSCGTYPAGNVFTFAVTVENINETLHNTTVYIDDVIQCSNVTLYSPQDTGDSLEHVMFSSVECPTLSENQTFTWGDSFLYDVLITDNKSNALQNFTTDFSCFNPNKIFGMTFSTGNPTCLDSTITYGVNATGQHDMFIRVDCYGDGIQILTGGPSQNPTVDCIMNRTRSYLAKGEIISEGQIFSDAIVVTHSGIVVNETYPDCFDTGQENGQEFTGLFDTDIQPPKAKDLDVSKSIVDLKVALGLSNNVVLLLVLVSFVVLNMSLLRFTQNHIILAIINLFVLILLSVIGVLPRFIIIIVIITSVGTIVTLGRRFLFGNNQGGDS